jgi:CDP-diacylglycerol---glycerol-3-phosphate 3-phosphatidyltransferase
MNPRIRRHGASAFLGYCPMEAIYSLLMPVASICAARGLSPNLLSWACLGLGFASGVVAALGGLCLGGALTLAAGCCDALDGMVARLSGVASEAGEVLDAAADRYSEFFFLSGLIIWYRSDVAAMTLALAALVGSLMVSYSRAKADAMRVAVPPYWMRRPERVSYLGSAAMLSPLEPRYLARGAGARRSPCERHGGAPLRLPVRDPWPARTAPRGPGGRPIHGGAAPAESRAGAGGT